MIEIEVFEGSYQENAQVTREALLIIDDENLNAQYYEIPYGERFAGNKNLDTWTVDAEFIRNMLDTADKEIERQLDN